MTFGIMINGCALGSVATRHAEALDTRYDRDVSGIIAAARAAQSVKRGDDEGAGQWLVEAWSRRDTFVDDRVLRDLLSLLTETPRVLSWHRQLEDAAAAAGGGLVDRARTLASTLEAVEATPKPRERARLLLLRASLVTKGMEAEALANLKMVTRLTVEGPVGDHLKAQALLLSAGLHHRAGRYKEAMKAYLKVGQGTGLWRQSRVGLAWCQLRVSNPKRSIAILALLPGGIVADSERALISAMAAGALGMTAHAHSVLHEARKHHRVHWGANDIDLRQVMNVALSPGEAVRLKQPDDSLLLTLASHPSVRLLAAELNRVEALDGDLQRLIAPYVAALWVTGQELVDGLLASETQRTKSYLVALDDLEQQLGPSPSP